MGVLKYVIAMELLGHAQQHRIHDSLSRTLSLLVSMYSSPSMPQIAQEVISVQAEVVELVEWAENQ